jgi:hypothetical protein
MNEIINNNKNLFIFVIFVELFKKRDSFSITIYLFIIKLNLKVKTSFFF